MSFLDSIFASLEKASAVPILQEIRDGQLTPVTGGDLLERVGKARAFLSSRGLRKGDRVGLLAHNGVRWAAMDLALMAEGLVVVPLYARQAPAELVAMMKDCSPSLICCGDETLRAEIVEQWPAAPQQFLFDQIFTGPATKTGRPQISDSDAVTIIYTSGTSGEAKGVILNAGNIGHMLGCTSGRLDILMKNRAGQDRVFHYL